MVGVIITSHSISLEESWIKAAVEHKILKIKYFSSKTKKEITEREVEPDFVGASKNNLKQSGLWATFCHLRKEGPRLFKRETVLEWEPTEKIFEPSPKGRWKELLRKYDELQLKEKNF